MKLPISILWNTDTQDQTKTDLVSASLSDLSISDKTKTWDKLTTEQKEKLVSMYYTKEEQKELKISDLDKLSPKVVVIKVL